MEATDSGHFFSNVAVSEDVISEDIALYFEREGLMQPAKNGVRNFSPLLLRPLHELPTFPSRGKIAESFKEQGEAIGDIEVPAKLYSVEAYMYIGLIKKAAQTVYDSWVSADGPDTPNSFLVFALDYIEDSPEPEASDRSLHDWNRCLIRLGVNEKFRRQILKPEFEPLLFTAHAKYWAMYCMEMSFMILEGLDEILGERLWEFQEMESWGQQSDENYLVTVE